MVLIYGIIALLILSVTGIFCLYLYSRKKSQADYQKLQNIIASLKMQNIRNRMSPHFFFNVLSGMSGETSQPEKIKKDLNTIAMLLRRSIENIEQNAVTVAEELEVVKGYIELQRWRLTEPYNVSYDIVKGTNMNHLIPAMIIQIPVENAIKYGLLPLEGEKVLGIKIENYVGGLKISVEDNGTGYGTSVDRFTGTGTGLKILHQTILLLNSYNSEKIEFSINGAIPGNHSGKGTIVEIKVPVNYSFDIITDCNGKI